MGVNHMAATATTGTTGKVTWFEIGSPDPARARAFYGGMFGWQAHGDPGVYLAVQNEQGISGGIIPTPPGVAPYAAFCVEVPDVDAAVARALDLGAEVVIAAEDNPNGVRSAYLKDPDGSLFAVYRFRG
jgi:uncharacterized protein